MITDLLAALVTYLDASDTGLIGSLMPGGAHLRIAPRGKTKYCILDPIADPAQHKYGGNGGVAFTEPLVQVEAWDSSPELAATLLKAIVGKLDVFPGVLASGQTINWTRTMGMVPVPDEDLPQQDERGDDGFGWMTTYQASLA